MKNTGLILAILSFFLLVTAGVFFVTVNFLDREFVDIYRPQPPLIIERLASTVDEFTKAEQIELERAGAMAAKSGDAAKARADFDAGMKKNESDRRGELNAAREHFLRVINDYEDKNLVPETTLYLGNVLAKMEDWEAAREQYATILKNKSWLDKYGRAQTNYMYALCLENLGRTDDAIKAYNVTIVVYGAYFEWSIQALERAFELAYRIDDPEKKLQAYSYLKKMLYVFQNFKGEDGVSNLMTRLRERLAVVRSDLGVTAEKEAELDWKLGISLEQLDRSGGLIWAFNWSAFIILIITGLLTLFSIRKEERFWRYFAALGLVSVMSVLGYLANGQMMEIIHRQQEFMSGGSDLYNELDSYNELLSNGEIYYRKSAFVLQSMLGLFVMMLILLIRAIKPPKKRVLAARV